MGTGDYIVKMDKTQTALLKKISNSIRILSADAVEHAASGHPGLPLGFSDVFTVLITKFLRYNPKDPTWKARDRLVLSAGHGSMLLYSFLHFAGYKGYEMEQIKMFRQVGSHTPGHPEYNPELAIETTTGPLGQGFANGVGISIGQKKYHTQLPAMMNYKTYIICGDGCLMEGITSEAASLAGHLGLNNLIILFDDNQITIDGATSLAVSDDHIAKFQAMGWNAYRADGHDFASIEEAIESAQNTDKPTLIAFRTIIGLGAGAKEGSEASHGAALGKDAITSLRAHLNWDLPPFHMTAEIYELFTQVNKRNIEEYDDWLKQYENLTEEQKNFLQEPNLELLREKIAIYSGVATNPEATRVSSGKIVELLQKFSSKVIVGSADLSHSNGLYNSHSKNITASDFSGNFIHFGVRENAMSAIMNGLATQGFLPICGTFLVFSDYMRPSIRLSALMKLQVIYIMTHDSIGVGEDGPTHQPIEHLASLRAMPNLNLFRPADMLEVEICFNLALSNNKTPSILALTRHKVSQIISTAPRMHHALRGAYILQSDMDANVAIWATGSEVEIALQAKKMLNQAGIASVIISAPSLDIFFAQDKEYVDNILSLTPLKCIVEAGCRFGWDRILSGNDIFVGIDSFGASGPAEDLYKFFKITPAAIVNLVLEGLEAR